MAAANSEPGVCSDCSKRYCKVEAGRTALRDAVNILEKRVEEITQENDTLKEEVIYAKSLADHEKDAPAALKKEIILLKSELHSLQENMRTERSETAQEVSRLRVCVSDSEKEIKRLKEELIKKEKSTAEAALKMAEVEKQKKRAEKKLILGKHLDNMLCCELKEERKKNDKMLKKQAVSMNAEAERQTKLEQVIEKRVIEEKTRADNLFVLFEDEKRKNHELQSKITELASSKKLLEANDSPMDKSNNAEDLKKQLEIEKQKTIKEEKNEQIC